MSLRIVSLGVVVYALMLTTACGSGTPGTHAVCGNNLIEGNEECDGTELGGATCSTGQGTVTCTTSCKLDESGCSNTCGNGVIDGTEACDGSDLGGQTCTSQGFGGGDLACGSACAFDTAGCCSSECALGDRRCDGTNGAVETCGQAASGCLTYTVSQTCDVGDVCDASSGTPTCITPCEDTCNAAGDTRCRGTEIEVCATQTSGCLAFQLQEDCAGTGAPFCDDTAQPAVCSTTCVPQCTAAGTTLCSDDAVATCVDVSSCLLLSIDEDCVVNGEVCDDSSGTPACAACIDTCAASEVQCSADGEGIEICAQQTDGCLGWQVQEDCSATGEVCDTGSGAPACNTCASTCSTVGASRCANDVIETCVQLASGCFDYVAGTDCADTLQECDDSSGTAACVDACTDLCSPAGSTACSGNILQTCELQANGCHALVNTTDCSANGQVCDPTSGTAACVAPCSDQCTDGDRRCNNDAIQLCAEQVNGCTNWQEEIDCADTNELCDDTGADPVCYCEDACADGALRCTANALEQCQVQATGCYDWTTTQDCASGGQVCYPTAPACIDARGDNCSAPWLLTNGTNVVQWTATVNNYMPTVPSCVTAGVPTGPDIVMQYTAAIDGWIDVSIIKNPNNRIALVVSSEPCGTVTEHVCATTFTPATLDTTVPVTTGTTYYFYLVDTSSGTAPLIQPVTLTITERVCFDSCPSDGATQCNADAIETCNIGALGCLEWTPTTDCTATSQFCNEATGTPQCLSCQDECASVGDGQCDGTVIESCQLAPNGCTEWVEGFDCGTTPGQVCDDTLGGAPGCALITGEDCASSYILSAGVNTVDWSATTADYITTTPSCVASGTVTGPDVVMRYTATTTGYLEVIMNKPTSQRYAMLISSAGCGTISTPIACVSDFDNSTMGNTFPVTQGTTYFVYVVDTTSGSNPLPDPLTLTVNELSCLDGCSPGGASRCTGDLREECMPNALGCREWLATQNCALTGEACFEASNNAFCSPPVGENCANAYVLSEGVNNIGWVAFDNDYFPAAPSCQTTGGVTGPDVVFEYTAHSDGFLDVSLDKPSAARFTMVVSNAPCGNLTSPQACLSASAGTALTDLLPVTSGTTYYFYVIDTTDGAAALPNPLTLTVVETTCPQGQAGNVCAEGTTTCESRVIAGAAPALDIPDNGGNAAGCNAPGSVSSSVVVTRTSLITDVDVLVDVTHPWDADADLWLGFVDANGTSHCVELSTDNGSSGDNFTDTLFDDEAPISITAGTPPFTGGHRPEGSLASLYGLPMNGTWTLYVSDDEAALTGTVNSWSVHISYDSEAIRECQLDANGCHSWVDTVDCSASGLFCNDSSGTAQCSTCADTCPVANATRCQGDVIETCTLNAQGCHDWTSTTDCAASGGLCAPNPGGATCLSPLADTCSNAATLTTGLNTVNWLAFGAEYVPDPACDTGGNGTGPDVVLAHTAQFTGDLTFSIAKTADNRHSVVVSDQPCGSINEILCASEFTATTLSGAFPVTQGSTYYFYVVDSTSGAATLPEPLEITLGCNNACTSGETRCAGDTIETCSMNPAGCTGWSPTTDCSSTGETCDASSGAPLCSVCTDLCSAAGDTRCDGPVAETCIVGALGCLEWGNSIDCAATGQDCANTPPPATCFTAVAEDCSSAFVLSEGNNQIAWMAVDRDYIVAPPSCQSGYANNGPDLVLQYTAQATGFVDYRLNKPTDQRFTILVSSQPCGTIAGATCVSEFTLATMGGFMPVTGGTTYYFYVTDTASGTQPLPNPLSFNIEETSCPAGAAGDACPGAGDTRCGAEIAVYPRPTVLPIADNTGALTGCPTGAVTHIADPIAITDTFTIDDVDVRLDITHTYQGDIDVFLGFQGAGGVTRCVELTTDNGAGNDNFSNTIFDDEAPISITAGTGALTGRHRPETPLSVLDGLPVAGTFTLFVSDDAGGDTGTLNSWALEVTPADGTYILTCTAQADGCLGWSGGVDCAATGQSCADGSGSAQCVGCQDTCPFAGDSRCTGEVIETCSVNAQGCVDWVPGVDCAASGEFCDGSASPAACVPCFDQCTGGNTRCTGDVVEVCGTSPLGCLDWILGTDCTANGEVCTTVAGPAECVACDDTCPAPGNVQCGVPVENLRVGPFALTDNVGNSPTCGAVAGALRNSFTVSNTNIITDVDVGVDITHTYTGDLDIFLQFVDGNGATHCVELATDVGGGNDNFTGTIFDDEASAPIDSGTQPYTGRFRPETPLSALYGLPMNGTWTLYIGDDAAGDVGTLNQWNLTIGYGDDTVIASCEVQASGCLAWAEAQDCSVAGNFCDAGAGSAACLACQSTCPLVGASRCNGEVIESCELTSAGCVEWVAVQDCSAAALYCQDDSLPAICMARIGEDCSNPYALAMGTNVVDWLAATADYLSVDPTCDTTDSTGPDLVLEHVAAFTGSLQVTVNKPTNTRWHLMATEGNCGYLTPELACRSEYTAATMAVTVPVHVGNTYYFYLVDSTSGANPLSDPLTVELACADACAANEQRCSANSIETCQMGPTGCFEWTPSANCAASGQSCNVSGGVPFCSACGPTCPTVGATRCNGTVAEVCELSGGCQSWSFIDDCAAFGQACVETDPASCATPAGEDCSNPYILTQGTNGVRWSWAGANYLTTDPSCNTTDPTGPDVVMQYTATSTANGFVSFSLEKPSSTMRYHVVVSEGACGALTPEVGCFSEATQPAMTGVFPVAGGVTYTFYAVDSTGGTAPLPNPLMLTLTEHDCASFAPTVINESPANGGAATTRSPVLTVNFDAAVDPTVGVITVQGSFGGSVSFDLATSPADVAFTNNGTTMTIDPGLTFAYGEQVTVSWLGLEDANCGNAVPPPAWQFAIPSPSCTPGTNGMVGTSASNMTMGLSSGTTESFVKAENAANGWVYVGGLSVLARFRPSQGQSSYQDVRAAASLVDAQMGYDMVLAGSQVFTLDTATGTTGRLFRISSDGVSWSVQDFASFATAPADDFRAALYDPMADRIYMLTEEDTVGMPTEIWSVSANPSTIPDQAVLDLSIPSEGDCSGFAFDAAYFYLACDRGDRIVRVDRGNGSVTLISSEINVNATKNALAVQHLDGDGLADVLFVQVGTKAIYYICDPSGFAPIGSTLVSWGTGTTNYGMDIRPSTGTLWAFDDNLLEVVQIQ